MSKRSYPTSLAEIEAWRKENGVSSLDARLRFMEFVVLHCIGVDPTTQRAMVLKGGNALRFAYQSPRSTKDLDFSVEADSFPDNPDRIRGILDNALRYAEKRFGVKAKCQRVKRNPTKPAATHPTYDIGIGFQFPGDAYFQNFEERDFSPVVPLEISFNDLVCEAVPWRNLPSLRHCSQEDILAEKLRSLLQQKTRNRNRYQDVYDIAERMRESPIDRKKIGEYLKRKSAIRDIDVRKSSFDDEIRSRAKQEYDSLIREQAPRDFIPFEEAWQDVLSLVQSLDIPD